MRSSLAKTTFGVSTDLFDVKFVSASEGWAVGAAFADPIGPTVSRVKHGTFHGRKEESRRQAAVGRSERIRLTMNRFRYTPNCRTRARTWMALAVCCFALQFLVHG